MGMYESDHKPSPADVFTRHAQETLENREIIGTIRDLTVSENLFDFSSNDYLGLSRSHTLHRLIEQEAELVRKTLFQKGERLIGSTGSRLLAGNSKFYESVEKEIASFHQR